MDNGFPRWVEDELWNWSRWCWTGDWPHPLPPKTCASVERAFPSGPDWENDDDDRRPDPVHVDNAQRVDLVYQALSLIEQRIMQCEWPRRHEYDEYDEQGAIARNVRGTAAPRYLGVSQGHYRVVVSYIKSQVLKAFR